jgi:hypothetical protein
VVCGWATAFTSGPFRFEVKGSISKSNQPTTLINNPGTLKLHSGEMFQTQLKVFQKDANLNRSVLRNTTKRFKVSGLLNESNPIRTLTCISVFFENGFELAEKTLQKLFKS